MTPGELWLATTWPIVRAELRDPPGRVIDVGCGELGGFVPMLLDDGYDAVGVDPNAPDGAHYRRTEFERAEHPRQVESVVASASLHHVANPAQVLDRIAATLQPGGTVVVLEWAWETFDAQTADWCFARVRAQGDPGWLRRRREEWVASGQEWPSYLRQWAEREGLHRADALVALLDERFDRRHLSRGPYFFADLPGTTEADEQTAIDAGHIRPTRINYVGTRPDRRRAGTSARPSSAARSSLRASSGP